jgi:hypothetical protein
MAWPPSGAVHHEPRGLVLVPYVFDRVLELNLVRAQPVVPVIPARSMLSTAGGCIDGRAHRRSLAYMLVQHIGLWRARSRMRACVQVDRTLG